MGAATGIAINESLLSCNADSDQSGETLAEEIPNCMKPNGLDLSRLRGQGYDGTANISCLSSKHTAACDLRSFIYDIHRQSLFALQGDSTVSDKCSTSVHCMACSLNLALNDAIVCL